MQRRIDVRDTRSLLIKRSETEGMSKRVTNEPGLYLPFITLQEMNKRTLTHQKKCNLEPQKGFRVDRPPVELEPDQILKEVRGNERSIPTLFQQYIAAILGLTPKTARAQTKKFKRRDVTWIQTRLTNACMRSKSRIWLSSGGGNRPYARDMKLVEVPILCVRNREVIK